MTLYQGVMFMVLLDNFCRIRNAHGYPLNAAAGLVNGKYDVTKALVVWCVD